MTPSPVEPARALRPTHARIDLTAISDNVAAVATHVAPAAVMPVVKANAYGHGLTAVGLHLQRHGVEWLGVAYVEEGVALRRAGVEVPILVMGGSGRAQADDFLRHRLTPSVSSVAKLRTFSEAAEAAGQVVDVHLQVDTGMERLGVHWYSAEPFVDEALRDPHVRVEGIWSHLANGDAADLAHAREQVARFESVCDVFDRRSVAMPIRHLANSGGVLQLPEAHLDLVRPGIMIYGVLPDPDVRRTVDVRPALRWVSEVVYVKTVRAGSPVSYGSTWAPDRDTRIVTVPVGYGDGYLRLNSNRSEVLVGGRRCPVVGRVCMDQLMVDVGEADVSTGDEVVLVGGQGSERITAEELGAHAETIGYEVLTNVNERVPRVHG
ncbi:MAG: alanine racemase [Actinomycetota bacterium]